MGARTGSSRREFDVAGGPLGAAIVSAHGEITDANRRENLQETTTNTATLRTAEGVTDHRQGVHGPRWW